MRAATDLHTDPTGFPMVWCEPLRAFIHWLPVTKIQFEHFLCAAPDAYFDGTWYETALALNPRVTPREITFRNYWRALMTAVQPAEAQRFASWCGDGYRLLTGEQWTTLYRVLRARPAVDLAASGLLHKRDARTCELMTRIDAASRHAAVRMNDTPVLASQMLLRYGAMEWVRGDADAPGWSVKGEPLPEFCGNLERPEEPAATLADDADAARLPAAGFRLLWSPHSAPNDCLDGGDSPTAESTGGG